MSICHQHFIEGPPENTAAPIREASARTWARIMRVWTTEKACGGLGVWGVVGVARVIMRALETRRAEEEEEAAERETGVKRSSGNVQKEDYK